MKIAVRRTTTTIAALATAGISSLFMGAVPANAAPVACGTGTLIAGTTTCQQTFTSSGTFIPTSSMTHLQVLLVGGGGSGEFTQPTTTGYATAGGGGEVKVVDFSAQTTGSWTVTVGASDFATTVAAVTAPTLTATAAAGHIASSTAGGASGGNGSNAGGSDVSGATYGGGGGASQAASGINAGDGITPAVVAGSDPALALFSTDTTCFGGGGAVAENGTVGAAGCGANAPTSGTATTFTTLVPNSGGGGGATLAGIGASSAGAAGYVEVRWDAPTVTLAFVADGHGATVPTENVVVGTAPTKPADPTASGYAFKGWFTDSALTTPADFTAPLTAATTFYAKWLPSLAATGGAPNQAELPIGIGTLVVGAGLLTVAIIRRRRRSN